MRSIKMNSLLYDTEVNAMLWRWSCNAGWNGNRMKGPIFQSKALPIAKAVNADTGFKASNQWLDIWKKDTMSNAM